MSLFLEAGNGSRALLLEHCAGITFGGELITPEKLGEDTQDWQRRPALVAGITSGIIDDGTLLQQLAHDYMPLIVIGDHREKPVTLDAELARFHYRTYGDNDRESFAVRLIPTTGLIARIILGQTTLLAVNYCDDMKDHVSLGLGNGMLHLYVYYRSSDKNTLPPLTCFNTQRALENFRTFRRQIY
ncbi:MAG: hypothetical protein PHV63_03090 [Candidatus Daviesbacteria bacterium]|nr:hypothetical protein [Candidatus Daviesbacteria bacterium]